MRSGVAAGPLGEVLPVTKSAAPSTCRECRELRVGRAFQRSGTLTPSPYNPTLAAVTPPTGRLGAPSGLDAAECAASHSDSTPRARQSCTARGD